MRAGKSLEFNGGGADDSRGPCGVEEGARSAGQGL